uniref:Uncharacterized protein n=1 Tax=Cacopsylla melanoneura TaxID=428564 RepID=A0A8D9BS89_9HEMI
MCFLSLRLVGSKLSCFVGSKLSCFVVSKLYFCFLSLGLLGSELFLTVSTSYFKFINTSLTSFPIGRLEATPVASLEDSFLLLSCSINVSFDISVNTSRTSLVVGSLESCLFSRLSFGTDVFLQVLPSFDLYVLQVSATSCSSTSFSNIFSKESSNGKAFVLCCGRRHVSIKSKRSVFGKILVVLFVPSVFGKEFIVTMSSSLLLISVSRLLSSSSQILTLSSGVIPLLKLSVPFSGFPFSKPSSLNSVPLD